MNPAVVIREAIQSDVAEILRQRRAMFLDMDYRDSPALSAMVSTCEPYLVESLSNGSFRGWLALLGERIVGGGAVVISSWPSHPYDLECRRATILNVYVYPEFRRQGIARRLMETMIQWCRRQKFATVFLHASQDGRHLYESLGFKANNEMKLKLSN
jgi:ribosomal protein S18 acetylase RimI-like enzyme